MLDMNDIGCLLFIEEQEKQAAFEYDQEEQEEVNEDFFYDLEPRRGSTSDFYRKN